MRAPSRPGFAIRAPHRFAAIPLASWGFSGGFPKDVAALCLVDHRSDAEKPLLELGDPVRAINEGW
jgi:hypothetical protein